MGDQQWGGRLPEVQFSNRCFLSLLFLIAGLVLNHMEVSETGSLMMGEIKCESCWSMSPVEVSSCRGGCASLRSEKGAERAMANFTVQSRTITARFPESHLRTEAGM